MKLKRLPSMGERLRYINIQIISEYPIELEKFEESFKNNLIKLFGELEYSNFSFGFIKNLYDKKNQSAIIRCNNKSLTKIIASLNFLERIGDSRIIIKIKKISGTLKGLI